MRILILGGYGVFGARLAQLLSDRPELDLIIGGRDLAKASAFCASYQGAARARPLKLDRLDIAAALDAERPDLVVDASGPFQGYGANPYVVIEACIAAGIDYVDLADSVDFVSGVAALDAQAKAAGVVVLSGVSTCPVLTSAVLREMSKTMTLVDVDAGIAPSPFAGVGLNVVRAVVSYAGAPVGLLRDGKPADGPGLAESRRFTVAVPGTLPLRSIHFSLAEVPDLRVLPREYPSLRNIWFGAGPTPEFLHRMLNGLAAARAHLGLPSLEPLSPLFHWVLNAARMGEHRGGMFVRARGIADGKPAERTWHLLAEGDSGPFIPSMAVEAIVRKRLDGIRPDTGARAATHALALTDYDAMFARRGIVTGFRTDDAGAPLYRRILADAYDTLPTRLRELHGTSSRRQWQGRARVEHGHGLLAKLVRAVVGFPKAGENVPVSVAFTPQGDGELWTRTFDGRSFSSVQYEGEGKDARLLVERFGVATFSLALVRDGDKLLLVPRRWSLFGLPMPPFLLPRGVSFEHEEDGRFHFDVEIAMPIVGRIVHYQGSLAPSPP
ncbi:SDR family oxidoreductase [Luteibacter yeojuensis]|uniref:Saccharopine dehydrogenase n=1 Tax=Luteibacter yeojuensis TaxID=345309 RepID=A0A0F3KAC0_9GAMM|nr:SDR family oxidoreductase [Luteibacter yeojuensis]KJV28086.1 saccharopine dehydrogenase [Luteibacter yeojuensis]